MAFKVSLGRSRRFTADGLSVGVCLGLILAAAFLFSSCSGKPIEGDAMKAAARPAVPVLVGKVAEETIPVQIEAIGSGEALATVSVKSQVQGEVQRAYFRQGQFVKPGDLLFTIDAAPFEASLAQAQGNLAKDEAQLEYAESTLTQNTALYHEGIIAQNQYDQYRSNAGMLRASVEADKAAIQTAQIQVGYCTIRAPIGGQTGALLVDPGNVIQSVNTALVTINQINPIYVDFSVPQQYLPEIEAERAQHSLRVEAELPNDPKQPEWGGLTFVNNTVDNTTGTILLKGTFPNVDRRLWPGQYVNVTLTLSEQTHATIAASPAVQTGENGDFVYVVKPNHTVAYQPVKVGRVYEGNTVIEKGLTPGETVVTDGQLMLYPGARVEIKTGL
ncbi:MAG TPA: efflux RND transporter periplasmic adaptor subunit [Terriglobia bacterium]|nr:efflux RND transporter periplasmic adaptor subunit [Terriglobia bacterium]